MNLYTHLLFIFFITSGFWASAQDILYVDINSTGSKNGTSWTDAYTALQTALDNASEGDQIWVAAGTYLPTESPDDISTDYRERAFHFNTDLQVYGGFVGTETTLDQRDPQNNPTILSGDFNGDDAISGSGSTLIFTDNDENAYHVLISTGLTSNTVIDGFTISGGNADGLVNGNISYEGQIFVQDDGYGAGMYNIDSSPTITNTTFTKNYAARDGGGIYNTEYSDPSIIDATFTDNYANYGGGIYNSRLSVPSITNVTFANNYAGFSGGGIYNYASSSTSITNSIFTNNYAGNHGGGMVNHSSYPTVTIVNTTFTNNYAGTKGGGIYNTSSSPRITNCVFWANRANDSGDNAYNDSSTPNISYSIIEGSGGSDSWDISFGMNDGNNLDTDPLFADINDPNGADNIYRTSDDGLALKPCSPAINAGTNDSGIDTDILGNPSPYEAGIRDIGAYEFQGVLTDIIYVNIHATGANNGTSWKNALTDLQHALDMNCSKTEIWVATGTYLPTQSPDGTTDDTRDRAFHFSTDLQLYGGFAGTETTLDQRDPQNNPTILSGDLNGDDVIYGSGITLSSTHNDENTYHILITHGLTIETVIDGFTLSGGNANGSGNISYEEESFIQTCGAGMYNMAYSSPNIVHTTFKNNSAYYGGGIINEDSSNPLITSTTFTNNSAKRNGGGIFNIDSSPTITNTIFTFNSAYYGGGIFNAGSSPTITNTTFTNNSAHFGGGIFNDSSSPTITNSIIWANAGDNLYNSYSNSTPTISYSIIEASGGSDRWDSSFGTDEGGNLDTDPLFINSSSPDGPDNIFGTADDGLALKSSSPAINAGDNSASPVTTDILGNRRPYGNGIVDIGAYEFLGEFASSRNASEQLETTLNPLLDESEAFQVYPNPASNKITVIGSPNMHSATFYSISGTIMLQQELHSETLNIGSLKSGLYIVDLKDKSGLNLFHFRLIKTN